MSAMMQNRWNAMTELDAIRTRHSVRQYLNKPLRPDELAALRAEVDACNRESGWC